MVLSVNDEEKEILVLALKKLKTDCEILILDIPDNEEYLKEEGKKRIAVIDNFIFKLSRKI